MNHPFFTLRTHRTLAAATALTLAGAILSLAGCSKPAETASATPVASPAAAPLDAYDRIAQQTRGFTVGKLMSANAVYVLFDPQCPHCSHLWQASQALLKQAKFVWVPVSIINSKSTPQGAALLSAANPAELMAAHEASILAGTGGIAAPSSIADDIEKALKANTQVFGDLKGESVPMIVAKNAKTGALVTRMGALDTPALAEFLGLNLP
jgi:thiol:disulfide interchange protein DsbG